jgi:16S rRNA (guanine966-N2)-methyltransferase
VRVTGGTARGRRLKVPRGIRPTSDLVRGAIFDALDAQGVDRSRVLDLYAGSGALGIEALSRGSDWCDFVERDAAGAAAIRENLALTGLEARAKVHRLPVERAAERLEGRYTLVLADPPYADETAEAALASIAESALLAPGATLVLEHSSRRAAPETLGPLPLAWRRRYGDTEVSIYRAEE